jgi:hypothetical protein
MHCVGKLKNVLTLNRWLIWKLLCFKRIRTVTFMKVPPLGTDTRTLTTKSAF